MSFWILIVSNCCTIKETKIYKTQDDAIDAAIIEYGEGKLYKTPDGTIWYFLKEYTEQAYEFNGLKELIKKNGFFETKGEPSISDSWGDTCTIREVKMSKKAIMKPKNVKDMKKERYCNCCDSFFIHDLCEDCWRTSKCFECEDYCSGYTDNGKCQKLRKLWKSKRKEEGWKGDEKDEGMWDEEDDKKWLNKARYGLSMEKDETRKSKLPSEPEIELNVMHYPGNKGKAFRSSDGIVYIETEKGIVAIGFDIKNNHNLSALGAELFFKLKRMGIEIDQSWRKGNNDPILFSDYSKMTSPKKD